MKLIYIIIYLFCLVEFHKWPHWPLECFIESYSDEQISVCTSQFLSLKCVNCNYFTFLFCLKWFSIPCTDTDMLILLHLLITRLYVLFWWVFLKHQIKTPKIFSRSRAQNDNKLINEIYFTILESKLNYFKYFVLKYRNKQNKINNNNVFCTVSQIFLPVYEIVKVFRKCLFSNTDLYTFAKQNQNLQTLLH